MIRRLALPLLVAPALVAGCASTGPQKDTLAELRRVKPDVEDVRVDQGLEMAMHAYRRFLEETPESPLTPEAMRRLADLQVEKEFGIRTGDGKPVEMAAPERAQDAAGAMAAGAVAAAASPAAVESDLEFELRTTAARDVAMTEDGALPSAAGEVAAPGGALEAIALYERLLAEYPGYEHNDQVLYQMARAYDELGRTEDAMQTMERLIGEHPYSARYDEVQFRRGEFFFTRRKYRDAESAYASVISLGPASSYHELALYKLGWTFYKQEFYEEALHRYMAMLDYKVSIGYDFDRHQSEDDERRVTDTFRVISLSFSNLGGPEVVQEYYAEFGQRGYEDRIYANLGEHYLEKLRYDDAAKSYRAFEQLYPFHRAAPHFGMRVVDVFTRGGFPQLVLESKRDFAGRYGLESDYWRHFDPAATPEVLGFLKSNLTDLAQHYHAQYQDPELAEERVANYGEAQRWYREFLASFPADPESPPVNYQLADLLLENGDFGQAAVEYERTAYQYAPHERSAAAGYAAIFAHREELKTAPEALADEARRRTVESSLRFADAFPQHEHAAMVLGAAADDLYLMKDLARARQSAQRVVDIYPAADPGLRRGAWIVVANASFDLEEYPAAERAFVEVLAATPAADESRAALVDNLAASIYKQGEQANEMADYRVAADHFLRIRTAAPTSTIRAAAEYDAGAALMRLQDWNAAAKVFEEFRGAHPDHELSREATKQIAFSYRESGQSSRAADEYDRLAAETDDPALRAEALLVAGELHQQSGNDAGALTAYRRYVTEFERPVETAVETRSKIAAIHKAANNTPAYLAELVEIVRVDAAAGADRTGRTRTLAARSALVLAEKDFGEFAAVQLTQPFEASLQRKQALMDQTIDSLGRLVDYAIADVTAAATFYIAETYLEFSRALMESELPAGLGAADLAEYKLALEEEAYPFEEKAIEVHQKNLALLRGGVVNGWTDQSLGKLATLVPGRYARAEVSTGFLPSMESYAYRSPAAANAGLVADGTGDGSAPAERPQPSGAVTIAGAPKPVRAPPAEESESP